MANASQGPRVIIVGGYTKSGTTFLGRVLEAFQGVYSRGEMDYLRIFAANMETMLRDYNQNIERVNNEVYDGNGALKPLSERQRMAVHQRVFTALFFNGAPVPADCEVIVEKSPHNVYHARKAKLVFPGFTYVNMYRPVAPVYKSFLRHMADHRTAQYRDPESPMRRESFEGFVDQWNQYVKIIESYKGGIRHFHYDHIINDVAGFLEYLEKDFFEGQLARKFGAEALTKEAYLNSLPPERRAKSLVQTAAQAIELSAEEEEILEEKCAKANVDFAF